MKPTDLRNRLLLIGKFHPESLQLKETLEKEGQYSVQWVSQTTQALEALTNSVKFGTVLINTELFTPQKLEMVSQLRGIGCDAPVLFLASLIHQNTHLIMPAFKKTLVVEKPIHIDEIDGAIERLHTGGTMATRFHKRFSTQEGGTVTCPKEQITPATIHNLSLGGAFIETKANASLGDTVQVQISLNKLTKEHEMHAQVLWKSSQHKNGRVGFGVRFLKTQTPKMSINQS